MKMFMTILLLAVSFFARGAGITSVSPDNGAAGSTVSVTMSLDSGATPPVPPSDIAPGNMAISSISGTSLSRSGYDVTATFTISAGESNGAKDCTVTFSTSNGDVSYSLVGGFTVTGGTEPVVGGTVTNQQPAAGFYPIVDTGQTGFYNASSEISAPTNGAAFYGQDGQVVGRQPDYTISGDTLTVHDNVTGLTWTRSHDWDGDGDLDADDKMTQANAEAYAATLNASNYGGYSDWRLPSIKELYSLMNFNGTDPNVESTDSSGLTPFIDNTVFDIGYGDTAAGERLIDSQFAVTTIYVDTVMEGQEAMFGLNLVDGRIKGYPTLTGKGYYAYYCRGNTDYGINDFEDNGDDTVSDHATGLMWAQADSGVGMDWENALNYAETNQLAGYSDWRLPNAKELQSLVDYTRSPGTTGSAAINPLFSATQITNMAGEADFPWYWSGTTHLKASGSAASGVYVCFGRGMGTMDSGVTIIDVHGAGCQRSDPKTGDPADYPNAGNGPQGDVRRVFNYVRLVRDVDPTVDSDGDGMSDVDEAFIGSDPDDPDSVFTLSIENSGSNTVSISWPVFTNGLSYALWSCTNLVEGYWFPIDSTTSSNLPDVIVEDCAFYRVEVTENN